MTPSVRWIGAPLRLKKISHVPIANAGKTVARWILTASGASRIGFRSNVSHLEFEVQEGRVHVDARRTVVERAAAALVEERLPADIHLQIRIHDIAERRRGAVDPEGGRETAPVG